MQLMNIRSYRDFIVAAKFHFAELREYRFFTPQPGVCQRPLLVPHDFIAGSPDDAGITLGEDIVQLVSRIVSGLLGDQDIRHPETIGSLTHLASYLHTVSETRGEKVVSSYAYDLEGLWQSTVAMVEKDNICLPDIKMPEEHDIDRSIGYAKSHGLLQPKEIGVPGANGRLHIGFLPEALREYITDRYGADTKSASIPPILWGSSDAVVQIIGNGIDHTITDRDILYFWFNEVNLTRLLEAIRFRGVTTVETRYTRG